MDYNEYYEEHRSELLKQMHELGYTPHSIVQEAMQEGLHFKEFIVMFLT